MRRRSVFTLTLMGLLTAIAAAWWFTRAPVVRATQVRSAPLVRTLQFSGRVATLSRVDLGSTLTGRVLQVAVIEGAQVRKGDVLIRLESDELRAALAQAQASEQQARARLAGLRSTGRRATRSLEAQSDSVLVAALAELRRTRDLVNKGFVSEARLDEVRRSAAVAQAQQAGARAQSGAVAEGGTDVAQAQAQLALAEAAAEAASARLAQAVLTAPADAKVLSRLVEPGQIVQPGRALMSLALAGPLLLVAQVDERYLEQLEIGQPVTVLADAFPEQRFAARVRSIAPLVDSQRGAVEVKFSLLDHPPTFLREDMTLSLEVETARRAQAMVVPVAALRADIAPLSAGAGTVPAAGTSPASGTLATVLISNNGRVEQRRVRLGLRTLESAEILEGLAVGDNVPVGAAPKLGARVRADPAAPVVGAARKGTREDAGSAISNSMGR